MEKHFKRTFMALCLAALLMPGMAHAQKDRLRAGARKPEGAQRV